MNYSVFIAFAEEDGLELALAVRSALASRGVAAFVANEDAPDAEDWDASIKSAQRGAKITLAVLTPSVQDSLHVKSEIQTGLDLRGEGQLVLPWRPPGGLQRSLWPSGLRSLQGPSGHPGVAVRSILALLRPSTAPARFADQAASLEAIRWLSARFPTAASRRLLLREHALRDRAEDPWEQLLADLDHAQLVALLERADDGQGEASDLIQTIQRGASPAPSDNSLPARLQRQLDHAIEALNGERFEEALGGFERLAGIAADEDGQDELVNRALLNQVAALNALDRLEEIDAVLDRVDPTFLAPRALDNFGRFLVTARRWDQAERLAPHSQVVGQLLALRRDQQLLEPTELVDDADVQLSAAVLHTDAGNSASAIMLAERVLQSEQLLEQGRRAAAEVIAKALYRWWIGLSAQEVADPGRALGVLQELLVDHAEDWPEVEHTRRLLELEPAPGLEPGHLDEHAPAWMHELQAGEALEAVATRHPQIGAVQLELGRWLLREDRSEAALEAMRRAFSALPGWGQRVALCWALLAAGKRDESEVLAGSLETKDEESWHLHVSLARQPTEGLERARLWIEARPQDAQGWLVLSWTAGQLAYTDEARSAARRVLGLVDQPSLEVFRRLAWVATTGGTGIDHDLVGMLTKHLRGRAGDGAEFEALRAELLLAQGDGTEDRPDWQALAEADLVRPMSLEQMRQLMHTRFELAQLVDQAWHTGLVCFETWAAERGMEAGQAALGIQRRELHIPPPVALDQAAPWRGRRCLVGGLAIEALAGLELLEPFAAAVDQIVVFSDVWESIYNGANRGIAEAWRRELERSATLWAMVEDLPTLDDEDLDDERLGKEHEPGVRAWLGQLGALPRVDAESWQPPPGPVVLGGGALLALEDVLEPFLETCRRQGIQVAVSKQARTGRRRRSTELRLRGEVLDLATRLYRWLASLSEQGRLKVLVVPSPPPLPPLRSGEEVNPNQDLSARAWAAREALRADPELVLVAGESIEWGVDGSAPFKLIVDRDWTRESYRAHKERYATCRGRVTTVATVARELTEVAGRLDGGELLAAAGYVDAFTGPDLIALYDRYGTLAGDAPRRVLRGLVSFARGPERLPHHSFLAMTVGFRLVSEAVEHLWFDDRRGDAGPATRGLLGAIEDLDRAARWRHGLLTQAVTGLALRCLQRPEAFVEQEEGGTARVGLDSSGGRLWAELGAWAADEGRRTAALYRGVAAALRTQAIDTTRALTRAYATLMVLSLPAKAGMLDLSSEPWAVLLTRYGGASELGDARVGDDDHTLSEWLEAVCSGEPPVLDPAALRLESPVELSEPRAVRQVHVPVEFGLDVWGRDLGHALAVQVGAHDERIAARAEQWATALDESARTRLVTALADSPLRAVHADPRAVLEWSTWRGLVVGGIRSIAQLEALLGEYPEDRGKPVYDRLMARVERDQGRRNLLPLLLQHGRMPGAAAGAGARRWLMDPEHAERLLSRSLRLLEHHRDVPAGDLGDAIVALAVLAGEEPVVRVDEQDLNLPQLVADLAIAALAPGGSEDDVAAREPALVRLSGSIVAGLATGLHPQDWIWLSWRLHGWLLEHILAHPQRAAVLADLCRAAPDVVAPERATDPYDPRRFAPGRVDLRELIVLQALSFAWALQRGEDGESTAVRVDWGRLLPLLQRIATRPLTPDEALVREAWLRSSMGGRALCAPDLARLLLLVVDTAQIWTIDSRTRITWLDEALSASSGGDDLRMVREMVLVAVASTPDRWSAAETEIIVRGVSKESFDVDSTARRTLVVAAFGAGGEHLSDRALTAVTEEIGTTLGPPLAGEWLLGHARLGDLPEAVALLRRLARDRGADPVVLLQGLSRVVLSSHRDKAVEVLQDLVADSSLAEGLEPLLRYATGEEDEE